MQDRLPPARRNPLATHGRTIHQGQTRKYSLRAHVFRSAPNNGHRTTRRHVRVVPNGDIDVRPTGRSWREAVVYTPLSMVAGLTASRRIITRPGSIGSQRVRPR